MIVLMKMIMMLLSLFLAWAGYKDFPLAWPRQRTKWLCNATHNHQQVVVKKEIRGGYEEVIYESSSLQLILNSCLKQLALLSGLLGKIMQLLCKTEVDTSANIIPDISLSLPIWLQCIVMIFGIKSTCPVSCFCRSSCLCCIVLQEHAEFLQGHLWQI